MNAGFFASLVTSSSASWNVAVTLGFAGLSKPRWLSLIWTNVKSLVAASALSIKRERGTPPDTVQTMAVPAQVIHFRKPRRATFGSLFIDALPLVQGPPAGPGSWLYRRGRRVIPTAVRNKIATKRVCDVAARSQDQGLAPRRSSP